MNFSLIKLEIRIISDDFSVKFKIGDNMERFKVIGTYCSVYVYSVLQ